MYNDNFNMNPDDFFGGYFDYFNKIEPIQRQNPFTSLYIALGLAVCVGVILSLLFLRKKNEKKVKGVLKIVYNFLNMNKFYAEDILRLLNLLSLLAISTGGVWLLFNGFTARGLILLVLGNVASRIIFELAVMFVILCRKSVSMDKRLSRLEAFYSEDFSDDRSEECDFCDSGCGECDCEECVQYGDYAECNCTADDFEKETSDFCGDKCRGECEESASDIKSEDSLGNENISDENGEAEYAEPK